MKYRLRRGAIVCCLAVALALGGMPARAVETGAGTRNFTPPTSVPDHFSNEAEPFSGHSAAAGPVPRGGVSGAPRLRGRASRGVLAQRGRLYHGRAARHVAARGPHLTHVAVRSASRGAVHAASHRAVHTAARRNVHTAAHRPLHSAGRAGPSHTASRPHAAAARRRG